MQQRQLRLGDILDDYCPRERRVTNHAVVAIVADTVKQTRCTTCDAEHEYKQAKVPRQRRKSETPAALYSQVLAGGPKRVSHDVAHDAADDEAVSQSASAPEPREPDAPGTETDGFVRAVAAAGAVDDPPPDRDGPEEADEETAAPEPRADGPAHRRLIRATLPRLEGQPPPTRPAPEFTIRQPAGRQNRFRPRQQRGPSPFHDTRSGNSGNGMSRQGGRPPMTSRNGKRHDLGGRKRSK